jgi:ATP-binding cassette, subfamily B, bacterial
MSVSLRQYWDLLSRYVRPQRARFALLVGLLLSSIVLQVINPQIMRFFIDTALNQGAMQVLMAVAGVFIGIAILQQVVAVSVTYLGESVAWTATNALRAELAWHCLNLDLSFHNEHTPGELIERIDGDITELANFFSQFVVTVLGNLLLMLGILVALFREDWRAGLVFSVFAAAAIFALIRMRNIATTHQKARRQAEADLFGFVEEQLTGAEDIRSSGAVSHSLRELIRLQANILRHDRLANVKVWILNNLVGGILAVSNILAVGMGYLLFTRGAITVGTAYLFIHYINLLESPLWTLTRQMQNFQTIGACVERLSELRKIQPTVVVVAQPAELDAPDGHLGTLDGGTARPLALEFNHVSFAYHTDDPILCDLSFTLEPGRVLGLLGRTGSGKSTLTRLVFRLYDPLTGQIRLDGVDVRQSQLEMLRRSIGIVTQEVQLFRATIRDNLTFFDRTIPDEKIRSVLTELELDDWYAGLPAGLDTSLEAGGHSLSAGEAQLLAFARIFLRDPGLVILDEASSRLDPATEQRIEHAIDRLLQNRSAIIVAHRLGTVGRADDIMILEDGRISEYGRREQLAGDSQSQFYHLLQTGLEEVLA